jgi:protein-disulfide isomerase
VSADDDPAIGPVSAPVTIIEFSDYQCPFCARADDTVKRLLENYKGKVRLVFRDFPSPQIHAYAMKAAEAAACAHEQGKFWEYHDALYADQSKLTMVDLLATAGRLGLNDSTFQSCVESGKFSGEVSKDMEDGIKAGVNGTPSFFINGVLIAGAQRYEKFAEVIDAELARGKNQPKAPQK